MNCAQVRDRVFDYAEGQLSGRVRERVEHHLRECPACRAELASFRTLREHTRALPREIAPERELWEGIYGKIADVETTLRPDRNRPEGPIFRVRRFALTLSAAAVLAMLVSIVVQVKDAPPVVGHGWTVAAVAGSPLISERRLTGGDLLGVGQWLETDAASQARVEVGAIGEVVLAPNSRLRLVNASSQDHRLELARGRLSAFIWAPPRLFFVETPSAVAVDLGCAYTLEVDDDGHGELHVTSGYVALQQGERESIVPAGAKCVTRKGAGVGTPYTENAGEDFRRALNAFDFGPTAGVEEALKAVLAFAQAEDSITLWHLLRRTDAGVRGEIFDKLSASIATPRSVTREGIIAGDADTLRLLADELGFGRFVAP